MFSLSYFAFQFSLTQNKMLIELMHYITYYTMFSKVPAEREVRTTLYIKKRTHKAIESAIRCMLKDLLV